MKKYEIAKLLIDSVKGSSITFSRKKDIATIYYILGNNISNIKNDGFKEKLDCYQSSANFYAKSKSWNDYCQVLLKHSMLLNDKHYFKESFESVKKILNACIYLNSKELGKILNYIKKNLLYGLVMFETIFCT